MKLTYQCHQEIVVKEYLKKQGIPRVLSRKIHLYGTYRINGIEAKNWFPLHPGDILEIEYQEEQNPEILPSPFPLDIVYEDQYLLIVNKPADLASQPSRKHFADNLVGRVKYYFNEHHIPGNMHIVTRLDYATSGLVIIAKDGYVHYRLSQTEIVKKYLAVAEGIFSEQSGIIDLPIEREAEDSMKRTVTDCGKRAVTEYRILGTDGSYSLAELILFTGRCHQIRVHLSHIGHPVLGDKLYGSENTRLYLHAYYLRFSHPLTDHIIEVCNYPDWYESMLTKLTQQC